MHLGLCFPVLVFTGLFCNGRERLARCMCYQFPLLHARVFERLVWEVESLLLTNAFIHK